MSARIWSVPTLCFLLLTPALAEFGRLSDGRLDMPGIRTAYMNSDFGPVRHALEAFMKRGWKLASRDEKVFTHMYLGVIYAADSIYDVRAESHFNALLDIAPNIELVDMFLPPKIQNMFDRTKRDFLRMKEYGRKYDALGNPLPAGDTARPGGKPPKDRVAKDSPRVQEDKGGSAWVWWTLGAAAAVGAGVGTYYLVSSEGAPKDNVQEADFAP